MTFIGSAPFLVGLSCKEARRVMERSYIQFDCLRGGPSTYHWVNLDKTLVYFGNGIDIKETFSPEERAKFKIVALDWLTVTNLLQDPILLGFSFVEELSRTGDYIPI
ncbi:hypothetical protein F5144DRAFT_200583 [Chaetomium tenue]|uniref:Uncharacterized protein n=1 Tax=Chaetomium tenue TaxID=1854479 RepID=A0ACB7PF36_9PEZI|nr:hypothetical protein F5144DRAFT_200583 [Chaetomium globosum]